MPVFCRDLLEAQKGYKGLKGSWAESGFVAENDTANTVVIFERSEKSLFASFEFLLFAQEDNHAVVYIAEVIPRKTGTVKEHSKQPFKHRKRRGIV